MSIRPVGPELFHADTRTDMTKQSRFSQFLEVDITNLISSNV